IGDRLRRLVDRIVVALGQHHPSLFRLTPGQSCRRARRRINCRLARTASEGPMSVMTAQDHRLPQDVADTLLTPAAYADGRIHETYRWLRKNEPLGVCDTEGVDPFWAVTRHADILEISRQNDLFS